MQTVVHCPQHIPYSSNSFVHVCSVAAFHIAARDEPRAALRDEYCDTHNWLRLDYLSAYHRSTQECFRPLITTTMTRSSDVCSGAILFIAARTAIRLFHPLILVYFHCWSCTSSVEVKVKTKPCRLAIIPPSQLILGYNSWLLHAAV